VRWTNGGCIAALYSALDDGVAGNLASGFHHSHADHGEGFCTYNGLVVALEDARARKRITRGLVLDMDLHYGNGTASLLATRPWAYQLSIYGNWYKANLAHKDVESERAPDTANAWSVPVPNGADGDQYVAFVRGLLSSAIDRAKPDVLLYQAGADPYQEDPYSPLKVDHEALRARDTFVFETARARGLPVMWVLAGGYTPDVTKVVRVHVNTFLAANDVFGRDRVRRHHIDVDDNVSVWAQTVDPVEPRPALEGVVNADVAIVGAGFTGMSTAYEMRRRFPDLGIVVLEARTVGNGASGRNGGMMLNWVNGIDSRDEALTKRIWATTQQGMDWITETIRREDLRVRLRRDGCLETFTSQQRAEEAHRKAERLHAWNIPCVSCRARSSRSSCARKASSVRCSIRRRDSSTGSSSCERSPASSLIAACRSTSTPRSRDRGRDHPSRAHAARRGAREDPRARGQRLRTAPRLLRARALPAPLALHRDRATVAGGAGGDRLGQRRGRRRRSRSHLVRQYDRRRPARVRRRKQRVVRLPLRQRHDAPAVRSSVRSRARHDAPLLPEARGRRDCTTVVRRARDHARTEGQRWGAATMCSGALGYSGHGVTLANLAGTVLTDLYAGDERWNDLPFVNNRLPPIPPEPFRWVGYQVYTRLTGRSPRRVD
jgi:glycine/D-amino acid oxidase-like deaminating enzyme